MNTFIYVLFNSKFATMYQAALQHGWVYVGKLNTSPGQSSFQLRAQAVVEHKSGGTKRHGMLLESVIHEPIYCEGFFCNMTKEESSQNPTNRERELMRVLKGYGAVLKNTLL